MYTSYGHPVRKDIWRVNYKQVYKYRKARESPLSRMCRMNRIVDRVVREANKGMGSRAKRVVSNSAFNSSCSVVTARLQIDRRSRYPSIRCSNFSRINGSVDQYDVLQKAHVSSIINIVHLTLPPP